MPPQKQKCDRNQMTLIDLSSDPGPTESSQHDIRTATASPTQVASCVTWIFPTRYHESEECGEIWLVFYQQSCWNLGWQPLNGPNGDRLKRFIFVYNHLYYIPNGLHNCTCLYILHGNEIFVLRLLANMLKHTHLKITGA